MARVRVYHAGVTQLARDMERIPTRVRNDVARVTRNRVKEGSKVARMFAFYTANRHQPGEGHGKHYWRAITPQMLFWHMGEWGPEADKQQGKMSFEEGSRKQPPHLDMLRSADLVVPKWFDDIEDAVTRWFW